jgi:PhoPQ-activated pathogenicity-related protein
MLENQDISRYIFLVRFLPVYVINLILFGIILILIYPGCSPKPVEEENLQSLNLTPRDIYVANPDPSVHTEIMYQAKKESYTLFVMKLISQNWLSTSEVDEPTWWHWVTIVVPDTLFHNTGFIWIGGGAKDDEIPQEAGIIPRRTALLTHSVAA